MTCFCRTVCVIQDNSTRIIADSPNLTISPAARDESPSGLYRTNQSAA